MNQDVTICLTNPKSPTNVGGILRACGCFGVDNILYTGNRYDIAKQYATDTKNAQEQINLEHTDDFIHNLPADTALVCVELAEGAIPLPQFEHPENAFYVFGPEDGSIKQEVVDKADHVVFMPTSNSLNLAAAVNVLLYDRTAKMSESEDYEELIKECRDVNNRLKVG